MNHDNEEDELVCPICLIQLVGFSGFQTIQSDIEGVAEMVFKFAESESPELLKRINLLLERAYSVGKHR